MQIEDNDLVTKYSNLCCDVSFQNFPGLTPIF